MTSPIQMAGALNRWAGLDRVPLGVPLLLTGAASGLLLFVVPPPVYAAVLVGLLLGLLVLRDPTLGFYLTVASIPLEAAGMVTRLALNTTVTITKVLAVVTLLAWAVHLVSGRRRLLWTRETHAFLLVMACAALSLVDARELNNGIQGFVRLGSTFAFFLMGVNLLTSVAQVKRAIVLLLLTSSIMFAFAVAQRFLPQYTFYQRAGWSDTADWNYGVEQVTIDPGGGEYVARASGTTLHAVVLSVTTASLIPLLVAFVVVARAGQGRWLAVTGLAAAVGANLVSVSRTGVVMLAICLAYLTIRGIIRLSPAVAIGGVLILAISAPLMPRAVVERLFAPSAYQYSSSESLQIRKETNEGALNAALHNPVNGLGVGNMLGIQDYYVNPRSEYLKTKGLKNFSTANNTYLQTAMEIGFPGLAALLYLFWTLWRALLGARRRFFAAGRTDLGVLCECMSVALIGMLAAGFTVDFVQQTFKGFWLVMACGVVLRRVAEGLEASAAPADAGAGAP
jgi:hypothetical protein